MSTSETFMVSDVKSSTGSVLVQPSEISNSYFPKGATASTLAPTISSATATPSSGTTASPYPLSPLDREYTKPLQDLDIAQQLLKQPAYWSVKGWLQRSASPSIQPRAEDPEARARKFTEAKRDLLASVGRF
ncbi:hypothetical protein GGS24DRAFT_258972 [Hypoxylon argillaceum]|nr:hypothetical protein GGS24DRAFT_258972 [Hypoxylon argillaceum]